MLLVWRMKQDIELQKTRSIVQAVVASASEGEKANKQLQEAWQDLLDEMYPFQRGQRKRADQAAMDYLRKEVSRGPYRITPLQPVGKAQSRMRTRYMRRAGENMRSGRR